MSQTIKVDTQEYQISLDGVIELPIDVDAKPFFNGLLDTLLAYVEQHEAFAGVSMAYQEDE